MSLVHFFRTNTQNHGNPEAVQKMCSYLDGDEAVRNDEYSQTQLVLNVGGTFFVYFYSNYVYFSIFFGEKYMTELRFWWNEQWALYIRPPMAQSKRQKVGSPKRHLTRPPNRQGLWVSRMVMPDLLFACSQHGRIASAGSKKVLTEVSTQMLRYAYSQRHRGIRFRVRALLRS